MNPFISGLIILSVFAMLPRANAQEVQAPTGAVETVYVRADRGVFIDSSLLLRHDAASTWSMVKLRPGAAGGKQRSEMAQNPPGLEVRKGDIVQLKISPPPDMATGPAPEVNRVTSRIAPAGSLQARQVIAEIEGIKPLTLAEALR